MRRPIRTGRETDNGDGAAFAKDSSDGFATVDFQVDSFQPRIVTAKSAKLRKETLRSLGYTSRLFAGSLRPLRLKILPHTRAYCMQFL